MEAILVFIGFCLALFLGHYILRWWITSGHETDLGYWWQLQYGVLNPDLTTLVFLEDSLLCLAVCNRSEYENGQSPRHLAVVKFSDTRPVYLESMPGGRGVWVSGMLSFSDFDQSISFSAQLFAGQEDFDRVDSDWGNVSVIDQDGNRLPMISQTLNGLFKEFHPRCFYRMKFLVPPMLDRTGYRTDGMDNSC